MQKVSDDMQVLKDRLDKIEEWKHQWDLDLKDFQNEAKINKDQLTRIEKDCHDIRSGITKALWIFGGGLVASVAGFIVRGGLNFG